jgi:cytoskeleton protein RodZ
MTDTAVASGTEAVRGSAGAMLRQARLAQGLDAATLGAMLKVPTAKIEALEDDRYDALPDVAFTRGLAQSLCRALKVDPSPVLARLPCANPAALERVDGGLNMPFRERSGRTDPIDWKLWRHPATWLVGAILAGALALAYVPSGWLQDLPRFAGRGETSGSTEPTSTTALPAILPASALAGGIVERAGSTVTSSPADAAPVATESPTPSAAPQVLAASAPGPAAPAADAAAQAAANAQAMANAQAVASAPTRIRAIEATWVQVTDGRGQILLSRLLSAGEAVGLDVDPPLKIRIGNARGTELTRRGQVVDLAASTRDNIASVELR